MALLTHASTIAAAAIAVATLVGCYDPALRDCAVSCTAASDCAGDQRCAGGWCAAAGVSCNGDDASGDVVDARATDARAIDARANDARPIDAMPLLVDLRIEVKGRGRVTTNQSGVSCVGPDDCHFDLPQGTVVMLTAVDGIDSFHRWRNACEGVSSTTCTVTVGSDMTHAKAEFE